MNTSHRRSVGPLHFLATLSHWCRDSDAVLEGTVQASISFFLKFTLAAGWWQEDKRWTEGQNLSQAKMIKPDEKTDT